MKANNQILDNDKKYMRLALREAELAYNLGEIPIGAIIVDESGSVVASGYNLRESEHDATAHAEVVAIRRACQRLNRWRLNGLTLYVTVEPCPMCAGAIIMSRLTRVVYGIVDSKTGACESLFAILSHPSLNHQPEVRAGVLADECAAIIQRFFRERRI